MVAARPVSGAYLDDRHQQLRQWFAIQHQQDGLLHSLDLALIDLGLQFSFQLRKLGYLELVMVDNHCGGAGALGSHRT